MVLSLLWLQKAHFLYRNCTTTGKNSAARLARSALCVASGYPVRHKRLYVCLPECLKTKVSFWELYLCSAGISFLPNLSSTSLPRAAAKGGGCTVPATSCHRALKWCPVKCYGCHSLAYRLIQTGKRFLRDNTRFVFLALFPPSSLLLNFSLKKESRKLLSKPKKTFSHLLLS